MEISTRDLQAFLALADLHSFTRAAARCHLSPSAFSARISSTEHVLGARLFDRTTRSVELTQAGALFLESARRLHADFLEVVQNFRDHKGRLKGRVAVAAGTLSTRRSGGVDAQPTWDEATQLADRLSCTTGLPADDGRTVETIHRPRNDT